MIFCCFECDEFWSDAFISSGLSGIYVKCWQTPVINRWKEDFNDFPTIREWQIAAETSE